MAYKETHKIQSCKPLLGYSIKHAQKTVHKKNQVTNKTGAEDWQVAAFDSRWRDDDFSDFPSTNACLASGRPHADTWPCYTMCIYGSALLVDAQLCRVLYHYTQCRRTCLGAELRRFLKVCWRRPHVTDFQFLYEFSENVFNRTLLQHVDHFWTLVDYEHNSAWFNSLYRLVA